MQIKDFSKRLGSKRMFFVIFVILIIIGIGMAKKKTRSPGEAGVETSAPDDSIYYAYLASYYLQHSKPPDFGKAELLFKKAIALDPYNSDTYRDWGVSYYRQKKYLQSETLLKKAIALDPHNYANYVELVICFRRQNKFKEAEKPLRRAIHICPGYANLADSYLPQNKHLETEAMLNIEDELNVLKNNPLKR